MRKDAVYAAHELCLSEEQMELARACSETGTPKKTLAVRLNNFAFDLTERQRLPVEGKLPPFPTQSRLWDFRHYPSREEDVNDSLSSDYEPGGESCWFLILEQRG